MFPLALWMTKPSSSVSLLSVLERRLGDPVPHLPLCRDGRAAGADVDGHLDSGMTPVQGPPSKGRRGCLAPDIEDYLTGYSKESESGLVQTTLEYTNS